MLSKDELEQIRKIVKGEMDSSLKAEIDPLHDRIDSLRKHLSEKIDSVQDAVDITLDHTLSFCSFSQYRLD